ncbi:MAG TPA: hypothetical protein VL282_10770, partial [Tepidisphaeraceae bacterium]|nr:hypothetical protein [Tepidisphaeraceae bacterium]
MLSVSTFFRDSNYLEACLWIAIGAGFAIAAFTKGPRGRCLIASVAFLLFGVSDYVEAHTGAWWRPWWLLLWKGGCLLMFLGLLLLHCRGDASVA